MGLISFGKGSAAQKPSSPTGTPVEQVLGLRDKGFTNNQIVQTLQRDGYKSHQIFDAMNQADLRRTSPAEPAEEEPIMPPGFDQDNGDNGFGSPMQAPSAPPYQEMPANQAFGSVRPQGPRRLAKDEDSPQEPYFGDADRVEEIAEAIIDEKWEALMKNIGKIVEWKNAMEARITAMEHRIDELRVDFESLHKGVLSKVNEYDDNISNVGTQIQAMEQVFQKVLPTFTENVNELSRLVKHANEQKKP